MVSLCDSFFFLSSWREVGFEGCGCVWVVDADADLECRADYHDLWRLVAVMGKSLAEPAGIICCFIAAYLEQIFLWVEPSRDSAVDLMRRRRGVENVRALGCLIFRPTY